MLKKILSGKRCAECRLCCSFDKTDVWETPVFSQKTRDKLLELRPETEFDERDGEFYLKFGELKDDELFVCPALTEHGCILGDDKPFDCRIWPYRIMKIGDIRAIALASICTEMYSRPLSELTEFLKDGLAIKIFNYADAHPQIVKTHESGYPVLIFEDEIMHDD